jgi:hypothetical protein
MRVLLVAKGFTFTASRGKGEPQANPFEVIKTLTCWWIQYCTADSQNRASAFDPLSTEQTHDLSITCVSAPVRARALGDAMSWLTSASDSKGLGPVPARTYAW